MAISANTVQSTDLKIMIFMCSCSPDLTSDKDSPPPPPPDVAQTDLMMRLGLLLGDRVPPGGVTTGVGVEAVTSAPETTPIRGWGQSASSLSSNEMTPERALSDTSPMSTLTGKIWLAAFCLSGSISQEKFL